MDEVAKDVTGTRRKPLKAAVDRRIAAIVAPQSFGMFMAWRMLDDQVLRVAASLSYTTSLAVVPAFALLLAMLTAFPAFQDMRFAVQDFILSNFLPPTSLKISEQLAGFVDKAGSVTAFGVIGLAITSIMLLLTIEGAFNRIFRVQRQRPLHLRLLVLWTVITVGPFLAGLSFTLFGVFGLPTELAASEVGRLTQLTLGQVMPTVVAWIAITFVYVVVPNRKVRIRDAMLGGALASVTFALLRAGFATYINSMANYEAIYGAVAALPVFLIWVYFSWTVIMAGAVITATLPEWRFSRAGGSAGGLSILGYALEIIAKLAAAQNVGAGLKTGALAKALAIPDLTMSDVLERLKAGKFVAVTDDGHWILSRDLDRVPLADVVHHFGFGIDLDSRVELTGEIGKRLDQVLRRAAESERTALSVSLSNVLGPSDESKA
ncbi:MAG: YihY family inner membrane protein [Alphaproteobacteria bacterium]|nr:YihY family inner membrane protein [Alphaproteobacteria bacterium]